MLRRDMDLLGRQFSTREVLEQIGMVGGVEVEMGEGRISRLHCARMSVYDNRYIPQIACHDRCEDESML